MFTLRGSSICSLAELLIKRNPAMRDMTTSEARQSNYDLMCLVSSNDLCAATMQAIYLVCQHQAGRGGLVARP